MSAELDVLRDVASRLDSAGIPYMLTGSMALNAYAQPRMTRDIDIVVELSADSVQRVEALFGDAYYVSAEAVSEAITRRSLFNLIHNTSIVKVDMIIRKPDEYRRLEFNRRVRLRVNGFEAWVVSKEDLILSKLLWSADSASEVQARDIRALLQTGTDAEYLESWAARLGVDARLHALRKELAS